jgi:hypothetical protein
MTDKEYFRNIVLANGYFVPQFTRRVSELQLELGMPELDIRSNVWITAATDAQFLEMLQRFWDDLPDSRSIRIQPCFGKLCELIERLELAVDGIDTGFGL